MELVLEDGTGVVTANSYATLAEVTEILSVNIHSKWTLLEDDDSKENLIIWASRILDERVRWNGSKTEDTSGLAWPRKCVRDKEGTLIDDDVVPSQVKTATALLAEHLLTGNPEVANTASNLTQLQVDVVMLKFDANLTPERYPPEISYVLRGLGWLSFGSGGPKRIIKH